MKRGFFIFVIMFFSFIITSHASINHGIEKEWSGGYCYNIDVKNDGVVEYHDWTLRFQLPAGVISSSWNANFENNGNEYSLTGLDWNNPLEVGKDFSIGFCADTELRPMNMRFDMGESEAEKNPDSGFSPLSLGNSLPPISQVGEFTPPFIAKNGKLYDVKNKIVQLRGVNWFGFAGDSRIVGGLWERNYKDIVTQMKDLGFNSVRLPFCPGTIRAQKTKSYSWVNPELSGKDSLETMDVIIQELAKNGFFILLDMHTSECKTITDTPFVGDYDLNLWVSDWKFVVNRYKNYANVVGVDPKNEPHGDAVWNDKIDNFDLNRKLQIEKIGKEILSINSKLLIFVEGIEKNHKWGNYPMDCEEDISQSWGGVIGPIECYPIDTAFIPKNKTVLSPHIYGPSVYPRDYFRVKNFPDNMEVIWEKTFGKFHGEYTIIIGEFGGNYVGEDAIWQVALIDYMIQKGIDSSYYWSWNPNSTNTKGLVKDDWITVEEGKYNNLKRIFFQEKSAENKKIIQGEGGKDVKGGEKVIQVKKTEGSEKKELSEFSELIGWEKFLQCLRDVCGFIFSIFSQKK